jgi:hypothetical protein
MQDGGHEDQEYNTVNLKGVILQLVPEALI